ncbi:MAG: thiolase domain-containing protein [Candidatus Diapherotrites archaeon]|nr:thiolase domain-containing protein [Candidatus Diapherotrites archaeon]
MKEVYIIGTGITKFGELWDKSFRDLAVDAGIQAIADSKVDVSEIDGVFGGTMSSGRFIGQEHAAALIADYAGITPKPAIRCEAACASGGVAFRAGYFAVASGAMDTAVVGGVEKMTDVFTEQAAVTLGGAGDQEWEVFNGATFPALYALIARRHMKEFGTTEEQLAQVAVKNHLNGSMNPIAQYQMPITIETVMNSSPVADPLKLFDCSPITDGAAAVVIASKEVAKEHCEKPIKVLASAQASDTLALHDRRKITTLDATRFAAKDAFKQADTTPSKIDIAEVHDCFTIAEICAIEDLGFFEKGKGGKATEDGLTALEGQLAVNTSGGLKACGHPVGATGIKQIVEAVKQLNQEAGKRNRKNVDLALTHNVGGTGATAVVHILGRGY